MDSKKKYSLSELTQIVSDHRMRIITERQYDEYMDLMAAMDALRNVLDIPERCPCSG